MQCRLLTTSESINNELEIFWTNRAFVFLTKERSWDRLYSRLLTVRYRVFILFVECTTGWFLVLFTSTQTGFELWYEAEVDQSINNKPRDPGVCSHNATFFKCQRWLYYLPVFFRYLLLYSERFSACELQSSLGVNCRTQNVSVVVQPSGLLQVSDIVLRTIQWLWIQSSLGAICLTLNVSVVVHSSLL